MMTRTSRVGRIVRVLSLATIGAAGLTLEEGRAGADVCFGGGGGDRREPQDGSGTDGNDAGDGSTLGMLHRKAGTRRKAGAGLVLVAGLGGAWLGNRRKRKGDPDGGGGPPVR
jgi:hypothetical protein